MIGTTVSHYTILEKLGEGGMGVVYKAEDTKLRRIVALKFLPPKLLAADDDRRRFLHEAQASASLNHPNIATVFEVDDGEAQPFIALELIEGTSLADKVTSGPLNLEEALSIAVQISAGLQAAHEKGIVHRDVKSQNVMVTARGQVKILDFGLAKFRGASVLTKAGTTLGTMGYMSPEQLRGEPVDQRTDLWALGVVLYEMIAGRRPFRGDYEEAIAYQVLNGQPEPLTAIRTGVPMELERIVAKLLSKRATDRYQSTTDVLVDLRALARTRDSGAGQLPGSPSPRPHKRALLVSGAAILLLAAAGILYFLLSPKPSGRLRSLAVLPFVNLSTLADEEYFADGMTDQLITELCKIRSVRIISRTSAMQFKGKHLSLPEIARTLHVDGIITATVLRSGDRVRINAQLNRGEDDENLWAETYERNTTDILELHSAIARTIAQQIRAVLSPAEEKTLSVSQPVNPEAFDLVTRGRYLVNTSADLEGFDKAAQLMRRAIALDPAYAEAYIGLASSLLQSVFFGLRNPEEILTEAEGAVAKALALDPEQGRAYVLRGQIFWIRGDVAECLKAHEKAIDLNPNDGFSRTNTSWLLMIEGRYDEGVREAEIAVQLDPLSQYARCNLMGWYYSVHRFADSRAEAGRILDLDSNWKPAHDQLYRLSFVEGKLDEALGHARRYWALLSEGKITVPEHISWSEYRGWDLRTLDSLAGTGEPAWIGMAASDFAMFGEKERALHWLEKAAAKRNAVTFILFYPDFDSLRDDPRFLELVSQMGLPVASYCTLGQGRSSPGGGAK
jgi:serine/threonine protein kinase